MGPLLLQLPPSFQFNSENFKRLQNFLKRASQVKIAIEFRDTSWNKEETFALLKRFRAALCLADGHRQRIPYIEAETSEFVYLRFHGQERLYASSYSHQELKQWAKKIDNWRKRGLMIYAYFNNDFSGFAFENAKTLKSILENDT